MLVKRSLIIGIVVFFGVMNFLLLERHLSAPPPPITLRTVEAITEPSEEWWGVYFRGEKIGYAAQRITPQPEGYLVQDSSLLRLNILETLRTVQSQLRMEATSAWALKRFEFDLQSNGIRFRAQGQVLPGKLLLDLNSGGHRSQSEVPLSQPPYLLTALKPYAVTQNLEPGQEHLFPTFDPATLSQQITTLVVEGREHIQIGNETEPAIRIRQRFKGISVVSWVDGQGRTLKEETPAGFSLVRQRAEEAQKLAERKSLSLDLVAQTAVRPDELIENPGQKNFLKLKLSGLDIAHFSLHTGRQRLNGDALEIRREDPSKIRSYKIPLLDPRYSIYLQSTPFLQSDHPQVRALVQKVLGGETDAFKAVRRIKDWVYGGLAKEPTVSIPNALEVLQTRKGDCNEHTVLFNALARAAGIPAKTVVGMVYLRGAFYYHAWSEVWLGEWISLDAVLNQFPADVTHIKFLEGEIDRQVDILQLIGKLKIRVVEAS